MSVGGDAARLGMEGGREGQDGHRKHKAKAAMLSEEEIVPIDTVFGFGTTDRSSLLDRSSVSSISTDFSKRAPGITVWFSLE